MLCRMTQINISSLWLFSFVKIPCMVPIGARFLSSFKDIATAVLRATKKNHCYVCNDEFRSKKLI